MNNSIPISVRRKQEQKPISVGGSRLNAGGNGLKVVGDAPFSASALHYYHLIHWMMANKKTSVTQPEVQKADLYQPDYRQGYRWDWVV